MGRLFISMLFLLVLAGCGQFGAMSNDISGGIHSSQALDSISASPTPAPQSGATPTPAPTPSPTPQDRFSALIQVGTTPSARWAAASSQGGANKLFVWSGSNGSVAVCYSTNSTFLNDGGLYDITNGTWTPLPTAGAPTARGGSRASYTGTQVMVWGGIQAGVCSNTGGIYDIASNSWMQFSQINAPAARAWHAQVWTGTRLIVWGGFSSTVAGNQLNDGASYNPTTQTWTQINSAGAPFARQWATGVWTGSKMIVWGGCLPYTNTGGIYDPANNTWSSMTTTGAPSPRCGHTAVWTGSRMIVMGGEAGGNSYNDGAAYDPVNDRWTPIAPLLFPFSESAYAWINNAFYSFGGFNLYPATTPFTNGLVYQ